VIQIRVSLPTLAEVQARLRALGRGVQDLRPALRQVGELLVASVKKNFELGGRPAWRPSRRARTEGGQTLVDRATLRNSIQVRRVDATSVAIGTNVRYAAAHQFGVSGPVQIPAHVRRVKSRDVYQTRWVWSKGSDKVRNKKERIASGVAMVRAHQRTLRIPPRPFLAVQPDDWRAIDELMTQHLRRLAEGSGQR
jgi:phage virion morphogenesis protein